MNEKEKEEEEEGPSNNRLLKNLIPSSHFQLTRRVSVSA